MFTSPSVEVSKTAEAISPSLPQSSPQPSESLHFLTVTSPIVGTFYRAPSPDADPYVEEGRVGQKGPSALHC